MLLAQATDPAVAAGAVDTTHAASPATGSPTALSAMHAAAEVRRVSARYERASLNGAPLRGSSHAASTAATTAMEGDPAWLPERLVEQVRDFGLEGRCVAVPGWQGR